MSGEVRKIFESALPPVMRMAFESAKSAGKQIGKSVFTQAKEVNPQQVKEQVPELVLNKEPLDQAKIDEVVKNAQISGAEEILYNIKMKKGLAKMISEAKAELGEEAVPRDIVQFWFNKLDE